MKPKNDITAVFMNYNTENPYDRLLRDALNEENIRVIKGEKKLMFPLTRTTLRNPEADILHLDWLYKYYMTDDYTGYKWLDTLITLSLSLLFILDSLIVSQLQIKIVRTVHNKYHHDRKYRYIEKIVNEAFFFITDIITVKCDRASEIITALYRTAKSEKIYVVPDGSYISAYENTLSKEEAREELSISDGKFIYLFLGQIRDYKGIPNLIEDYGKISCENTELWIVGQPADKNLEQEINDLANQDGTVHTVLEYIDEDRIQVYMNMADIFVLPYKDILNSGSVHLGLSFSLPIVAPDLGCIPASLPEENEFIYNRNEKDALKRELKHAYEHPKLEIIGNRNYHYALDEDWNYTAEKLRDVYQEAIR